MLWQKAAFPQCFWEPGFLSGYLQGLCAPQWASPALISQSMPEKSMPNCFWVVWNALIWHLIFWYTYCIPVSSGHNSPFQSVKWLPLLLVQVGYRKYKRGVSKLGYDPPLRVRVTARVHTVNEVGCGGWIQSRKNTSNSACWIRTDHRSGT